MTDILSAPLIDWVRMVDTRVQALEIARQASAEREKRANITKAEGDRDAAVNLADAARTMRESPGAMQLRTLQTIDGLGPTASNTVVLAIAVEVMNVLVGTGALLKERHAGA